MDLALNNLQRLVCHKTQQTKPDHLLFIIWNKNKTNFVSWDLNYSNLSHFLHHSRILKEADADSTNVLFKSAF